MEIIVTSGVGNGKTPLSAFDSALKDAGINNFNLIYISSIIPPTSVIKVKKYRPQRNQYGERLYVVRAEIRGRETGKYIGAGLGWYQTESGRGVFVEHEAIDETSEAVESNLNKEIKNSLGDLCRVRNFPLHEKNMKIKMSITKISDLAACTLVTAVYKAEKWDVPNE